MKGICFKEPLFNATVEGRKTQTRRIMVPQPKDIRNWTILTLTGSTSRDESKHIGKQHFAILDHDGLSIVESDDRYFSPRFNEGEVIYLKEPYFKLGNLMFYKYDKSRTADISSYLWENKLFMPAEAARYFIKITGVRAERLQDISEEDCIKEGICLEDIWVEDGFLALFGVKGADKWHKTPREAYAALIDKINGRGTWGSNPWVWVYDYELTEKP